MTDHPPQFYEIGVQYCPNCTSDAVESNPLGSARIPHPVPEAKWRAYWCRDCRHVWAAPPAPEPDPEDVSREYERTMAGLEDEISEAVDSDE